MRNISFQTHIAVQVRVEDTYSFGVEVVEISFFLIWLTTSFYFLPRTLWVNNMKVKANKEIKRNEKKIAERLFQNKITDTQISNY